MVVTSAVDPSVNLSLLRWHHPELGLVMPNDFIPLAEETGAIVPIGHWVLKEACTLLKRWETDHAKSSLILSINVSAIQFNQPDFVRQVELAILESSCDATKLCIELTESSVITHVEESIEKMHQIQALGVSMSIDDFGTGYSSLSALKILPLNELKIDRSFVKDFTKDSVDLTIVQTILQMGKNLNLRIVAEGVETESQMSYLSNYGCTMFQGYFFAKPCSIEYFENAFHNNKTDTAVKVNKKMAIQTSTTLQLPNQLLSSGERANQLDYLNVSLDSKVDNKLQHFDISKVDYLAKQA